MKKSPEIVEKVRKILNKKNNEFKNENRHLDRQKRREFTIYLNKFNIERTGELEPSDAMEVLYDCAGRDDVLVCWDDELTKNEPDDESMAFYIVPISLVDRMVTLNDLP